MADVAVDEVRLLKTMRWWDGFVIGLANPGFLLAGLAGSVNNLGPKWAAILWFSSAIVGTVQAYVYAECAAMFPDKAGGLAIYAKEGWKRHFALVGPIAVFGYWFAWSSVLAIYGTIIGFLLQAEFFTSQDFVWGLGPLDVTFPRLVGTAAVLACYLFNIRGMRPAVWFSYATGAMLVIPVACLAIIPLLNGDITSHALSVNSIPGNLEFYGASTTTMQQIIFGIVWFWVIGWSTYGPEAPATFAPEFVDTKNDTRLAILTTGGLNIVLSLVLPLTIVGVLGTGYILGDLTFIAYLAEALNRVVGDFLGSVMVIGICAGLLLSMNTATMDGSRALYGMARDGLTLKQFGVLNEHHVPSRAMTMDMAMNVVLIYAFPSIFFTLVAGNIGYVLAHIFALSGFLLLRRDRPDWPRPLRHGPAWIPIAWFCLVVNIIGTICGVIWIKYTGYMFSPDGNPTGYTSRAIFVGVAVLVLGIVGYVIGQRQAGHGFRWRDTDVDTPSPEVYELMAANSPASGD